MKEKANLNREILEEIRTQIVDALESARIVVGRSCNVAHVKEHQTSFRIELFKGQVTALRIRNVIKEKFGYMPPVAYEGGFINVELKDCYERLVLSKK